ncbi:LytTR family DNA-binding domain-containing protein [Aliifodinibius sp. S!AR15-10]|uniref:LytR/AlgR family response regulator transcription factor n=1 Tax=Aliifodinibius sp. S!AR15-10 TaxID=2950437 RepID=UPI00285D578C|nr:LytTR family DNA-binding domain-containing protein [Aliifodinibius sp. S!AR15-10]MDR8392444.1 LytTR family DNA-binding domain-containing protein [Aliifodinibius sp. S!AR15-10]
MKKWKCMIVDDEPVAIRVLRQHLAKINNYEVVHTSTDSMQAFECLSHSPVDLLLLDIEMPELNGIQLFKTLDDPPALILVTAHRDYAVEGFELNAIDYLMKPVSFPRFIKALDRFEKHQASSNSTEDSTKDYLFVTVDRKKKKINLEEIVFIESLKDYIRIYTTSERIITKETTSDFEERLPSDSFLRTHRSFIININRIDIVSHDEISLGKHDVPVGRSYKTEVRQKLGLE